MLTTQPRLRRSGHPYHSGAAANDLCMLADSSQRNPPCTRLEHPLNIGTSSHSALMGEQVAAQAQTLVLGSSSALTC